MTESLAAFFLRDLERLKKEVEQYHHEANLWHVAEGISNSGGNLVLHLIGNLKGWFGAGLAQDGYRRDFYAEWTQKDVSREKLLEEIEAVKQIVRDTLPQIPPERLKGSYPIPIPYPMNMEEFLFHLLAHFSYHLGQLNYHRRLLDA